MVTRFVLLFLLLSAPTFAQDDCPAGHIRNPQVSPLDHDYMVKAFTASFRGLFGRDPSFQPGSGKDDGEYYIAASNHFGVYGDDQCHAGWSGYWESWLEVGHGDLGRVQTPARFLPMHGPVPTPIIVEPPSAPVPTPIIVSPPTPPVPASSPLPSTDVSQLFSQTAINHAAEMALLVELQTQIALARQDIAEFRAAVKSKWVAVMDSPIVKYGLAAVSGWLLKIAVKP